MPGNYQGASTRTVCILCSQHVPDDVRVTHRIGKRLREEGYAVTWVGPERPRKGDDYGIRFVYYPPAVGKLGRLLTHASRLMKTARSVGPQDVYFAVEPDSAAVAVKLARRHKARAVFDIHEIYHQEMLLRWVPSPLLGVVGAMVRWNIRRICRACDLVVGVGQTRLDPYLEKETAGMVVRHCVPLSFASVGRGNPFPDERETYVILHGKATLSHGTKEIMEALSTLVHQHKIPCRIVMFRVNGVNNGSIDSFVGKLARELMIEASIDLRDPISYEAMFPLMQTCDVGVIAYRREFGRRCMPNRVFEYMATGIPVIVPSYAEEMERLIPRYECGLMCDTENPHALGAALLKLWSNKQESRRMGANGRKAFEAGLNWEAESRPLMEWIRREDSGA